MDKDGGYDTYLFLERDLTPPFIPGILEIKPLILPEGSMFAGCNGHLGWPVAVYGPSGTVVLFHRRSSNPDYRWGETCLEKSDIFSSSAVSVTISPDGKTISDPQDLKLIPEVPTQGCRLGFGNSIGNLRGGCPIAITPYGVFVLGGQGNDWVHIKDAFGGSQLKGPVTNMGPVLVNHPSFGIVAFGHVSLGINSDGTERILDELWIRNSMDDGRSWSEQRVKLPPFVKPVEPAALIYDNHLILLARSHGATPGIRRYVQLLSGKDNLKFNCKLTNITATDVKGSTWHGPWSQDTASIIYNPFTKRFEAVVTNRNGGGLGLENKALGMSLNLWSIDPEALLRGSSKWYFEGTLIQRRLRMVDGLDGMHPGGSVVDLGAGMQHLFCYMGLGWHNLLEPDRKNLSGIFKISRSLHTPLLFP